LYLIAGDPNRSLKIRAFRSRLVIPGNPDELPMMVVYQSCRQFIRTIPNLITDSKNIEDIDTSQEDHAYDDACHIAMARPLTTLIENIRPLTEAERDWARITGESPDAHTGILHLDEFKED
jgi:hypothetical protein